MNLECESSVHQMVFFRCPQGQEFEVAPSVFELTAELKCQAGGEWQNVSSLPTCKCKDNEQNVLIRNWHFFSFQGLIATIHSLPKGTTPWSTGMATPYRLMMYRSGEEDLKQTIQFVTSFHFRWSLMNVLTEWWIEVIQPFLPSHRRVCHSTLSRLLLGQIALTVSPRSN